MSILSLSSVTRDWRMEMNVVEYSPPSSWTWGVWPLMEVMATDSCTSASSYMFVSEMRKKNLITNTISACTYVATFLSLGTMA